MIMVLSLLVALLSAFDSLIYGEPVRKPGISFSVPFICSTQERKGRCLADSFKPGLNVALVEKNGICRAKSGKSFAHSHPVEKFKATRLLGTERRLAVMDDEESFRKFRVAVVGADPASVRVVSPSGDTSPMSKGVDLSARKLAVTHIEEPQEVSDQTRFRVSLSPAKPGVLRAENILCSYLTCR